MFQHLIDYLYDPRIMADATHMESILRGVGTIDPIHRRGGPRAHRQWKRTRAAGITKKVSFAGRVMSLGEACERAGLPYKSIWYRISHGWSEFDALNTPIGVRP